MSVVCARLCVFPSASVRRRSVFRWLSRLEPAAVQCERIFIVCAVSAVFAMETKHNTCRICHLRLLRS